jgi:hypothetical protein
MLGELAEGSTEHNLLVLVDVVEDLATAILSAFYHTTLNLTSCSEWSFSQRLCHSAFNI